MMRKRFIMVVVGLACVSCLAGCGNNNPYEDKELSYRQAGINYMSEGDYQEALTTLQKALDNSNGRITKLELDICYYKAKAQILGGDVKGAKETYDALIAYDSENQKAYYLRGVLYLQQNEVKKALADFEKALALTPDDYDLYFAVYQNLESAGQEAQADKILKKALEIGGTDAANYCGRGRIYLMTGDYDNAKTNLDKAINAGSEQAKMYMAQTLEATGEEESAYAVYESYAQKHEEDASAQNKIADLLMEQGSYEEAVTYYEKSVAIGDETWEEAAWKGIVICYEKQGDFAKAYEEAQAYLKKYTNDAQMKKECIFLETR